MLLPLSWLYGAVTDFRNYGYDKGWFSIGKSPCKTISVGNLTVGGTGKTPMIEFLAELLRNQYKIAIVSRGYGRRTKGLIVADDRSTAADIGDEPLQFYRKFAPEIPVIVAEKRILAAEKIASDFPETQIILLDDAFQHREIHRDVNILLTDYNRLFYKDFPFPAGNLRERRRGVRRADLVVVTKCPVDLESSQKEVIREGVHTWSGADIPVCFTSLRYGAPQAFTGNFSLEDYPEPMALSGLAQNAPFEKKVKERYGVKEFFSFPDHFVYSEKNLFETGITQNQHLALITTEKDMVKLLPIARTLSVAERCFYIPVQIDADEEAEGVIRSVIG